MLYFSVVFSFFFIFSCFDLGFYCFIVLFKGFRVLRKRV
ncbi:hypothetical protein predicted by Glimmer/Critica [Helicobacter pylori B8]|uniref:Uncharacterized protein n=1 Tax=Helicobacter pylori (strain B8) TaxID=693745 RepID=D7FCY1_HELP3|nr:hypothetical protein predicted by Glimmer/Critica [Helicobacter pylori B8]CBI67114.1 hypothetical protein predicted by Glimmer/Critica [Helicobacter pylori B8]